jgi:hypothetical protein
VRLLLALAAILLALTNPAAAGSQLGPKTSYSADEIQAAVAQASGYNSTIMSQAGNLGVFESGGNAGVFNGSCCTGVFQINTSNLASYGLTREQYANMSLQDQAQVWVNVTNSAANTPAVKQLEQMAANGQTFDGQPVDSAMITSCIQLGAGNCQKMLNSGSCSGFADSNGTTICDMAAKVRNGNQSSVDNSKTNPDGSQQQPGQQNGSSGDSGVMSQNDIDGSICWACTAVAKGFSLINQLFTTVPDELAGKVAGLFASIFAIVMAVQTMKHVLFLPRPGGMQQVISLWVRFAVVMTVITTSSLYSTIVQEYALGPALGLGGYIGNQLMTVAMSAFGVS